MSRTALARHQIGLFFIVLGVYWLTLYPSFYTFDSAELAIGATELGIVHSPGYPLYLLIAHIFTWLPFGDVGYRLNLLSAVCTALTVPILWTALYAFTGHKRAAALAALCYALCMTVWLNGTVTEVYAGQTLTLAIVFWSLMRLRAARTLQNALLAGACFGIAVALHPSSIFMAPAIVFAFLALQLRWLWCIGAGILALALFAFSLIYFPLRQIAQPRMNFAGQYDESGQFVPVDMTTIPGLTWMIRGEQFADLFFADGYLPNQTQLSELGTGLWQTYQGVGLAICVIGIAAFLRRKWQIAIWLLALLPYGYFYTAYGAPDRAMMLDPVYLLLSVALTLGFIQLYQWLPRQAVFVCLLVPVLMTPYSLIKLIERNSEDVRGEAVAVMTEIPQDAIVFGVWRDIVPLEYLQLVENQREDLTLRNLFFFDSQEGVIGHIALQTQNVPSRPIVFLSSLVPTGLDMRQYTIYPLRVASGSVGFVFVPKPSN